MSAAEYLGDCAALGGDAVNAMRDGDVRDITHRTFRRKVGPAALDRWAAARGYDTGSERGGLRLSRDWHVSYHLGTFDGAPCAFLCWSAFEHVWRLL